MDVFGAPDGALFLMRAGLDDFRVADASPADRALLDALRQGFREWDELEDAVLPHAAGSRWLAHSLAVLEEHGLVERHEAAPLAPADRERYDRQLIYFADLASDGTSAAAMQRRLGSARVLLLGCGGLGSWTAAALACAGTGELVLVDDDTVELSNLNRQVLFAQEDIGRLKVEAAADALRRTNPRLRIRGVPCRMRSSEEIATLLGGVDLVVSTADWPAYELPRWVNGACMRRGVPFITAGQFPPLVRVGPLTIPGETACLECWEARLRREHPRFAEVTGHLDRDPSVAATIGAASGLVGSMLAMEAIHLLTGAVDPATLGAAHVLDLRTLAVRREAVELEPGCPVCQTGSGKGGGRGRG